VEFEKEKEGGECFLSSETFPSLFLFFLKTEGFKRSSAILLSKRLKIEQSQDVRNIFKLLE